ncbi:hypothetical protein B0H11DRAFT_1971782 [Mycena galericulata]|nr:hypothetical protein B0H11DRAFT_1971782 [Mycena galericulata]
MFNLKALILLTICLSAAYGVTVAGKIRSCVMTMYAKFRSIEPVKRVEAVKPGDAEDGIGWFVATPSLMDPEDSE